MNWLLTLILLATILSWGFTHKYLDDIEELRKENDELRKEIIRLKGGSHV